MEYWKPVGWDVQGEECQDSWRAPASPPTAHHFLRESAQCEFKVGVIQVVAEVHTGETDTPVYKRS